IGRAKEARPTSSLIDSLFGMNGDRLRFGFFGFRQRYRQDAVLELSLCPVGHHSAWKRYGAFKCAPALFTDVPGLVSLFLFVFDLAFDGQDVIIETDLYLIGFDTWQRSLHHDLLICLIHVDGR